MDKNLLPKMQTAKKIVAFTGAGISAESGVPTFRGKDGLWKNYPAEELATPEAFSKNPALVWEWYNWRRKVISKCLPNAGHFVLSQMEKYYPQFNLITQNVDNLHRQADSTNIIELHGNIWFSRCTAEGTIFQDSQIEDLPVCPSCGSLRRPHIVWFGESLPEDELDQAFELAEECDLFFSVGTSALVYPAALLPLRAKKKGAFLVEINLEKTPLSPICDVSIQAKSGEFLPKLWETIDRHLSG